MLAVEPLLRPLGLGLLLAERLARAQLPLLQEALSKSCHLRDRGTALWEMNMLKKILAVALVCFGVALAPTLASAHECHRHHHHHHYHDNGGK